MNAFTVFLIFLAGFVAGGIVFSTVTWAISLGQKIKAFEAKEATAAQAELAKLEIAGKHDAALVEAAFKHAAAIWDKLKAEADAIVEAKKASVPPVGWVDPSLALAAPPAVDPVSLPPTPPQS